MKIIIESYPKTLERQMKWHGWFAWHPIRMSNDCVVVFVFVERRRVVEEDGHGLNQWSWEYRRAK